MTWTKLDDGLFERADIAALGHDACDRCAFVMALAHASRNVTDGVVPRHMLRRIVDHNDPTGVAARLVSAGLWEHCEEGWRFVAWADDVGPLALHQVPAAKVHEDRERDAARKRIVRRHEAGDHADCPSGKWCQRHARGDHSTCVPRFCDASTSVRTSGRTPTSSPLLSSPLRNESEGGEGEGEEACRSVDPATSADASVSGSAAGTPRVDAQQECEDLRNGRASYYIPEDVGADEGGDS